MDMVQAPERLKGQFAFTLFDAVAPLFPSENRRLRQDRRAARGDEVVLDPDVA